MTYLEIVNSVLKRLREDQVTSVSDTTYSALIGELVNTVKDDIERTWKWNSLRYTVTINTVADSFRYVLTGSGDQPVLLDIWNDTDNTLIRKASTNYLNRLFIDTPESGSPYLYGINGTSSDGDLQVDFYPIPDGVYNIDVNMVLSQAHMTADTDTVLINNNLLILGAWALAVSERGEDGGQTVNDIDVLYQRALSDAISIDVANQHESEVDWIIV